MTKYRTIVAALALVGVIASPAAAQETLNVTTIDGSGNPSTGARTTVQTILQGVNFADCEGMATITVTTPLGRTGPADLWIGDGDCTAETARSLDSPTCFHVGHIQDITANTFDVTVQSLITARPTVCESDADEPITVYVLYEAGNPYRGAVTEYGTFTVKIDGVPPSIPNISDGDQMVSGDSQVEIGWDAVNDEQATFEIVDGGDCDGVVLANAEVIGTANQGSRSTTIDPGAGGLGLELGETGAVHVAAVDEAGNRSGVSTEICVERIAVAGFCDVFTEMGGTDCDEAGCAVETPGRGGSPVALLLFLGAFLWTRRP